MIVFKNTAVLMAAIFGSLIGGHGGKLPPFIVDRGDPPPPEPLPGQDPIVPPVRHAGEREAARRRRQLERQHGTDRNRPELAAGREKATGGTDA